MKMIAENENYSRARRISLVWKYVWYGLILTCIPLIVLSFYFIHAENRNIVANEQLRFQKVADTAAGLFFENVQAMHSAAISLTTEIRLQDRYLGESFSDDNQAVRILNSYQRMLPFTSACGLYTYSRPETVYYSDGVWKKYIFERFVITKDGLLDSILKNKDKVYLSGWSEQDQAFVCAIPLSHANEELPRRVFFFVLNSFSIKNSFSMSALGVPEANIAGIWDTNGQLLFFNSDCAADGPTLTDILNNGSNTVDGSSLYYFHGTSNGYKVMLYVPMDVYEEHIGTFDSSIVMMIAVDVLLCFLLVGIFTYLNYKPIKKLMKSIGLKSGNDSEFNAISESYNKTTSHVLELQKENAINQRLLVSHVLEKLLNGATLRSHEEQILEKAFGDSKGCFFVAVAAITTERTHPVFEYEDETGKILPVTMLNDGFLAYICKTNNVNRYGQFLELISQKGNTHIGAGSISADYQNLHKSYLEAILALTRTGNSMVSRIDSVFPSMDDLGEEDRSMSIIQIARMLRNGDQAALTELDQMFDKLLVTDQPVGVKKYSCFQLIQKLQQSAVRMGLDFSEEQAAKILDVGNIAAMRNMLFEYLNTVLEEVRVTNSEALRTLSQKMMQIVESKYNNNALNLSMLADEVGLTEYTASHIFKDITGQNLQDYLRIKRINTAKELLLSTDDSVNDIALGVGFSSCSYFIRVFKAEVGMTPAAYRQTLGIDDILE